MLIGKVEKRANRSPPQRWELLLAVPGTNCRDGEVRSRECLASRGWQRFPSWPGRGTIP